MPGLSAHSRSVERLPSSSCPPHYRFRPARYCNGCATELGHRDRQKTSGNVRPPPSVWEVVRREFAMGLRSIRRDLPRASAGFRPPGFSPPDRDGRGQGASGVGGGSRPTIPPLESPRHSGGTRVDDERGRHAEKRRTATRATAVRRTDTLPSGGSGAAPWTAPARSSGGSCGARSR
jgi:hypothetical protein